VGARQIILFADKCILRISLQLDIAHPLHVRRDVSHRFFSIVLERPVLPRISPFDLFHIASIK
jgi:hypothetical protein